MRLPVWKGNLEPGVFAHVSWAAEEIMERGPELPKASNGPCPYEGLAFAVSLHPGAWARIARIGTDAPVVVLRFDRPAMDFYKWLGKRHLEEVPEVTRWAVRNGWVTKTKDVLVWHWGGEEAEKRFWRFPKGGKDESYYREQLDLGDEADEPVIKIEEASGWSSTQKLRDRVRKHYKNPTDTCLEAEVFNLWLMEHHPEFGMIWYGERLDPVNLSAPRGAILPPYFKDVKPVRMTTVEDWGEEEG